MFTKSFTSLRRFSGHALILLLFWHACRQKSRSAATPPVTASVTTNLTAPSGVHYRVVCSRRTWTGTATGSSPIGSMADFTSIRRAEERRSRSLPSGTTGGNQSYQNNNVVFDANNNMLMNGNYNNCLLLFPYNPTTKTWDGLST